MFRRIALGLVAACLAGNAYTQEIGGSYVVEGTNHDGSAYGGQARIRLTSDTTCEIEWVTGGSTSNGICSRNGNAFAAAYIMGESMGLVIYEVMADGTLEGLWTIQGQPGTGTERLRRR